MVPVLMFLISLGGTTYGMAEETIAFYALVTSTMVAAGFDSLTAASTILLGSTAGVLGSTVNPFSISASAAALNAAGIETNQTVIILVGGLSWILCYIVGVTFVLRYAHKVEGNKAASLLTSEEWAEVEKEYGGEKAGGRLRFHPAPEDRDGAVRPFLRCDDRGHGALELLRHPPV